MFLLRRISKGSVVVSYQLVLKREYALADLMNIMRGFIEWQDGKMGSFEVNADSIMFSGATFPWLTVVLGILGVLALGLLVSLPFVVHKYCNKTSHERRKTTNRAHHPRNRHGDRTADRHTGRHTRRDGGTTDARTEVRTGDRTRDRTGDGTNARTGERESHEYMQLQHRNEEYAQLQLTGRSRNDREVADATYETIASV
ncbi:hypothetical protein LSAT2_027170 [Lamellibrachia satsuma]|nr:hypothetical protein LSAT2_027170 [Lamellibrachia satsuma]